VLSCDLAPPEQVAAAGEEAPTAARDVMDGTSCPTSPSGAAHQGAAPLSTLPLDVHLMVEQPEK